MNLFRRDPLLALAVLGFALALFGVMDLKTALAQRWELFFKANKVPLGVAAAGLALFFASCLGRAAATSPANATPSANSAPPRKKRRIPAWLLQWLGVVALASAAGLYQFVIRTALGPGKGLAQVWAFLGALALFPLGLALLEARRRRGWMRDLGIRGWGEPLRGRLTEGRLLAAYLALWLALMTFRLDTRPGFFHGDEATVVMYGQGTRRSADIWRNDSPWMTHYAPYMAGIPRSILRDAFRWRSPYFGPRFCTVLFSTAALAALFALARAHLGREAAWLALLLASTQHVVMAFSRMGILNMDGLLLLCSFALAWMGAARSRRASLGALAGVCAGLAYYSYHGALLALPILAASLALDFIRRPRFIFQRWAPLAALALGFAAAAAPMRAYFRSNPALIDFRPNQVSIFAKRNLDLVMKETLADSLPEALVKRSWPAIGGALLWPDTSSNYGYRGLPILDRATCALAALGFAGALALWRRRRIFCLLALWCALGLVLGSLFTRSPSPPYVPRIMMTFPAAFLLAAWAAAVLARRVGEALGGRGGQRAFALAAAGFCAIAALNIRHYHFLYLNDLGHSNYKRIHMGFMEFLDQFPADASLIYFAGDMDQMGISCNQQFDKGCLRKLVTEHGKPIPEPIPHSMNAYVFKVPEFAEEERQFLAPYTPPPPPIEIKNAIGDAPPSHHVYWLEAP